MDPRTHTLRRLLVLLTLALFASLSAPALGWSPGPTPIGKSASEADAIFTGSVRSVREVKRVDGMVISAAVIDIGYWVYGGPGERVSVVFQSESSRIVDVPYAFKPGSRVLIFAWSPLRARALAPELAAAAGSFKPASLAFVLQFAKARVVGWKYDLPPGDALSGFLYEADPKKFFGAMRVARSHLPRDPVAGLRASLGAFRTRADGDGKIELQLNLQNVTDAPLHLDTYEMPDEIYLDLFHAGKALKPIEVRVHLRLAKRAGPAPSDFVTLAPGESRRIWVPLDLRKHGAGKGAYVARARYIRGKAKRDVTPLWTGTVTSNDFLLTW